MALWACVDNHGKLPTKKVHYITIYKRLKEDSWLAAAAGIGNW
jgi:hypothetical protein